MRIFLGFVTIFPMIFSDKDIYLYNNIYPRLLPKVFSENCILGMNYPLSYLLVQLHYPRVVPNIFDSIDFYLQLSDMKDKFQSSM